MRCLSVETTINARGGSTGGSGLHILRELAVRGGIGVTGVRGVRGERSVRGELGLLRPSEEPLRLGILLLGRSKSERFLVRELLFLWRSGIGVDISAFHIGFVFRLLWRCLLSRMVSLLRPRGNEFIAGILVKF
jgi:hypothetical protein